MCSNLLSVEVGEYASISSLNNQAFCACPKLSVMTWKQSKCPCFPNTSTNNYTPFGTSNSGTQQYTGYPNRGYNTLYVYDDSVGYDVTQAWTSVLLNSTKCGFNLSTLNWFDEHGLDQTTYDAQCEYIQTTGHEWINTGILGSNKIDFELNFTYLSTPATSVATSYDDNGYNGFFFGCTDGASITATNINHYLCRQASSALTALAYFPKLCSFNKSYQEYTMYPYTANQDYTLKVDNGTFTVNDGTTDTTLATFDASTDFTTKLPIGLLGCLYETVYKVYTSPIIRVKSSKIWDRSSGTKTLVRDFIPVRKDYKGYLYDNVEGKLYRNLASVGNGFIMGGGYDSKVEYLQSTGTQGFLFPYTFQSTDVITIKCQRLEKIHTTFFGSYVTNSTAYYVRIRQEQNGNATRFIYQNWTNAAVYSNSTDVPASQLLSATITVDFPNKKCDFNGDEKTISYSAVTGSASGVTGLFGSSNAAGTGFIEFGKCKIFSVNIKRSGTDLWNLVPVRSGTEGMMLDTLTHRIFFKTGTGDFVLGNDIN
jgi:hypothetical protein